MWRRIERFSLRGKEKSRASLCMKWISLRLCLGDIDGIYMKDSKATPQSAVSTAPLKGSLTGFDGELKDFR